LLGVGAGLLGASVGFAANDLYLAGLLGGIAALNGAAVGLPLGVLFAGKLMDGNGRWWAVIIGEVVGFGAAGALIDLYTRNAFDIVVPIIILSTVPAAGAAIGYELTSDRSAHQARARKAVQLRPSLRPVDRGFVVGLGGRF
jgi:hypothetical protein